MQNDFSNAKINDKIFHSKDGWGTVTFVEPSVFRARFMNRPSEEYFFFDGRSNKNDINPSVFWDEIKIIPPPKPKKKVEKTIESWLNFYEDEGRPPYYFSYQTKQLADEKADKEYRLGEACHVIHKYTIEK